MDYGVRWAARFAVAQFAMDKLVQVRVTYCTVDKYMVLAFDNILRELWSDVDFFFFNISFTHPQ